MKRICLPLVLALFLTAVAVQQSSAAEKECETFGTSVEFVSSPAEAAKYAKREEKLVLVLHVSGLFEDSDFT